MRSKTDLENVKKFVDNTYSRYGNKLILDVDKPYDPNHSQLGYCYKDIDPKTNRVIYRICCTKIGIPRTDFRVMMHEYGHIYLAHLDGIHEDLDILVCNLIRDHRGELIDDINRKCGIDFADKLLERVIDDPELNHSLHNIAMDMEVNSSVLSKDDVEEMEADITSVLPKTEEEYLQYLIDNAEPGTDTSKAKEALDRMKKSAKIKLILPCRYNTGQDVTGNPIPFPDDLTYADYLILIFKHFDQFIKMLVSIDNGGNGDTNEVSQEDIQNALNDWFKNKSQEYLDGYNKALQDLQNGMPNPNDKDYSQGFQDGYDQGMKNQQQSQSQDQGQQSQDQGQQSQDQGQQSQGQNSGGQNQGTQPQNQNSQDQGQGQQNSQSQGNQSQGQGNQGQKSPSYQQGFQDGMNAAQNQGQSQGNQGQGNSQGQQGQQNSQGQGNQGQSQGQGSGNSPSNDFQQGYQDALRDAANGNIRQDQGNSGMGGLNGLLSRTGMMQPNNKVGQKKGEGQAQVNAENPHNTQKSRFDSGDEDLGKDHGSKSRQEADEKRKLGQIKAGGGVGCGKGGGPGYVREVDKMVDEVDSAIKEVIKNVRSRVVKHRDVFDMMKLYNRGVQREVIAPSYSEKVDLKSDPKLVFLIDISGSMNTELVDRVLKTIAKSLYKLNPSLRYDIITWSTRLGEHIKGIDPKKSIPSIHCGGGTDMASGMVYFKNNYKKNAILILISDFEDSLNEWHRVESGMKGYLMYGFNYGYHSYSQEWSYFRQRNFSNYGYD